MRSTSRKVSWPKKPRSIGGRAQLVSSTKSRAGTPFISICFQLGWGELNSMQKCLNAFCDPIKNLHEWRHLVLKNPIPAHIFKIIFCLQCIFDNIVSIHGAPVSSTDYGQVVLYIYNINLFTFLVFEKMHTFFITRDQFLTPISGITIFFISAIVLSSPHSASASSPSSGFTQKQETSGHTWYTFILTLKSPYALEIKS